MKIPCTEVFFLDVYFGSFLRKQKWPISKTIGLFVLLWFASFHQFLTMITYIYDYISMITYLYLHRFGVGLSAIFIALYVAIDMLGLENQVDVFTIVKQMRMWRHNMLDTFVSLLGIIFFFIFHSFPISYSNHPYWNKAFRCPVALIPSSKLPSIPRCRHHPQHPPLPFRNSAFGNVTTSIIPFQLNTLLNTWISIWTHPYRIPVASNWVGISCNCYKEGSTFTEDGYRLVGRLQRLVL